MNNSKFKEVPMYVGASIILFAILIISIAFAVTIGSVDISIKEVYEVIFYKFFDIKNGAEIPRAVSDVIMLIRLPRIILAIAVGIGLSVCGAVMQAIVKNPLADPYILGISSGASLGANLAIIMGVGTMFGSNYIGIMGFLGAFIVSMLVLALSNVGGRSSSVKLLLSGMALSSVCSAFSSFIIYISNDSQKLKSVTFWLMGSLAGAKWSEIALIFPIVLVASIFFMSQYRILNLMLLGDETAITLGTDLQYYRVIYLIIASLIIGIIVYASGMIGFIGLIIPHIVRMIFGTDHKKVIPISGLLGAVVLIWADVLSRIIIKGTEIPIGILISIIGAPSFVYLMISKTYDFGGKK